MRPQVGQVINNKYRLLRLIGDGGMGSVYEARHEVLGTSVALKFLHLELSRRPGLVQRFLQEARVSAQIQSPHVVRVTDVDQTPNGAFIVMEYLEGRTLQALYEELYKAGQQLSYVDALEFSMQMLDGVEAAHKQGVVHRDLKPDNVMITLDGKGRSLLKLLDFGIAKVKISGEFERGLTRAGVIMGTPEYMAPEQAFSADAVDARADIFSLGVMIFEMLAGRRPVGGDDPQVIAMAYLKNQIAHLTDLAPSIQPELAAAVHKAMGAKVEQRWQTVTELRDAIEPFALAARAPSAVVAAGGSLSLPGISRPPVTPPATNVGGAQSAKDRGSNVPKTLPPRAGVDGAAGRDETNPAEPPVMSSPESRDPTPLGGFDPGNAERVAVVPPTRSVAPYVPEGLGEAFLTPGQEHASTAFAAPLEVASFERISRASGTAIGAPPYGQPGPDMPIAIPEAAFSPPPPAYVPPPVASRAKPKGKSRGSAFSSLPAILGLAAAVAGVVVGGLYLAQMQAKSDDRDDPPATSAPATTVASDPPTQADPPAPPPPSLPPTTRPPVPGPGPGPIKPKQPPPKGSGTQPQPPPSSRPPVIPTAFPIVIPTSFPIAFPFLPGPPPQQQDPPRSQPDQPPRNQPQVRPRQDRSERNEPQGWERTYQPRPRPGAMPRGGSPIDPTWGPSAPPFGPPGYPR